MRTVVRWQRLSGPGRVAALLVALAVGLLSCTARALAPDVAEEGVLTSVRGCEVHYRVHRASAPQPGPVVVIAHGFLRNGEFMAGWAEAIAREGATAVTVDLCASAQLDGRMADNGVDLVALRRVLGIEDVLYVGVSAGGLAAMIAASRDVDATRGVLLLDPVNAGGQARSAAGRIRAPVAALIAKPQVCNAWRNIDPALEALADATIVRVDAASHCDFEWPSDTFCRVACVSTSGREQRQRSETRIRDLGLSFVRAIRAGDSDALYRWKSDIGALLR